MQQLQHLISQGHVFKVQTNPQATETNTLHWCHTIKSPMQRCFPIPPSLNEVSVPEMAILEPWQQGQLGWRTALTSPSRQESWQWGTGPVGSASLDYRTFRAKQSQERHVPLEWNVSSASFVQMPEAPTGSRAGQPGAAQAVRKADTGPHQAAKTGRQRDWLARQWKISLNIWAVWSPRCSSHSLVLSLFVWGFPPTFPLCNIPFPCYFGTERKETAGRKKVKISVLFNIDKGFYTRQICRLQGCFYLFVIICSCADF